MSVSLNIPLEFSFSNSILHRKEDGEQGAGEENEGLMPNTPCPMPTLQLEGLSLSRQDGCGDEEPELFAGEEDRRLL